MLQIDAERTVVATQAQVNPVSIAGAVLAHVAGHVGFEANFTDIGAQQVPCQVAHL